MDHTKTPGRFTAGGTWTSLRGGWPGLDDRLQDAVKIHFSLQLFPDSEDPLRQEIAYDQNVLMRDFRGFPADAIDRQKVTFDMDWLRDALEEHWEFFVEALAELNSPVPDDERIRSIASSEGPSEMEN
jgi:hypothetical protein